jgi:hypothetical protein
MKYVVMVKMKVGKSLNKPQDFEALKKVFKVWMEDPSLKMVRVFHEEDPVEMKDDAEGFLNLLEEGGDLEFIAEGEQSEATEAVWAYLEDPARREEGILSYRASLNREESQVRLISGLDGVCKVFDTSIHENLQDGYDQDMPVQLTRHHFRVSGLNGEILQDHVIRLLEELRQITGGELKVDDQSATVSFEARFMMPADKERLYEQMNRLGQEVVQLEMDPLVLLAEDAFYYELAQYESRKLKIYSMSI